VSEAGPHTIKLSAHPRASRHIAAAKGWGGLIGFGLVLLLSLQAGATPFDAGLRALVGGMGLYLLAWFGAVMIWRELAVAEVAAAKKRLIEHSLAAQEAAEAARAKLAGQAPVDGA
jgi:hypothetical protein